MTSVHPKVAAASISAQAAAVAVFVLGAFGVTVPADIALEAVVVVASVAGYLKSA